MSKNWVKMIAALCACALLAGGAYAEEKRLGDLIYVPAMRASASAGTMALRVEGLALEPSSDLPVTIDALAGAEFGVYVISGSGELIPWANPLYPSEQMRIRTGEGETRFTLPQGAEFYLIQESAPQGYLFDPTAVIPVTGNEVIVRNAMAGQLVISTIDTLGNPIADVCLSVRDEDGNEVQMITDENGEAVLVCDQEQAYEIMEKALPQGVFSALHISGGNVIESGAVQAEAMQATRKRVVFEYPASGSVLLDMKLRSINEHAQAVLEPLSDVKLEILGDEPVSVITDEQGLAKVSLLEGTYDVLLSYEGDKDVIMPLEKGQMIISSGSTTMIELSAAMPAGRIAIDADADIAIRGGSVTFVSEESGKAFGPYEMDSEGVAVSEVLQAGRYRIAEFSVPQGTQLGQVAFGDVCTQETDELVIEVRAGEAAMVKAELLSRQTQRFALLRSTIDEAGAVQTSELNDKLELTLEAEDGLMVAQFEAADGLISVEALSGSYRLRMKDKDAEKLGLQPVSGLFALPSDEETILFGSENARVVISSVDENGSPVAGAVYQLTDGAGKRYQAVCDEDGMAVSPLLAAGSVTIETIDSPKMHSAAELMSVHAISGEAAHVQIVHKSYGTAQISVRVQSLDEKGAEVYLPLGSVHAQIYQLDADGQAMDAGIELIADETGSASVKLAAGEYAIMVDEQDLGENVHGMDAIRFSMEDAGRN